MLKKEFNKKDVNRARNLITGNIDSSTGIQVGYNKKTKNYKEGDIWEEKGKKWTIKNGIKQTISKMDKIKKEIFMPLSCPCCGKVMKKRLDKPNYRIHKKCLHCVIEFEHKLHCNGEYENYIKELKARNSLDMLDEMESYLLNAVNDTNESYISEQGDVERWVGGINKEKMTEDIIKSAQIRRESIKKEFKSEKVRKIN